MASYNFITSEIYIYDITSEAENIFEELVDPNFVWLIPTNVYRRMILNLYFANDFYCLFIAFIRSKELHGRAVVVIVLFLICLLYFLLTLKKICKV